MTTIYLALGSNIGDRQAHINRALEMLAPEIAVRKRSSIYETKPMYVQGQSEFFNMVCEVETDLSPEEVMQKITAIQHAFGAHEHNGPRAVDIDLIFYGNQVIRTPSFTIPHPKFHERDFVLRPLIEIAPAMRDPESGTTMQEFLDEIPESARTIIRAIA